MMLAVKIICLILCAGLLFVCYKTETFARFVLGKRDDQITDGMLLAIKAGSLVVSILIFIFAMLFIPMG